MSNSALNELGFAEFVAKLISDTFNAILSSQADQKNKINELRTLLAMSKEEFVDVCMQDEALLDQLDTELQFLFAADNELGHSVIAGSIYTPHKGSVIESPAYSAVLGIVLIDKEDFYQEKVQRPPRGTSRPPLSRETSKYYLSDKGVDKIERAIMAKIAYQQRASINSMMADGIPRLVVDSGKINAKLTFATELFDHSDDEEQRGPEGYQRPTPVSGVVPRSSTTDTVRKEVAEDLLSARRSRLRAATQFSLNTNSRFLGSVDTQRLASSRLKITPASNKVPQDVSSKTNIYSEVEIHFKTIL